MTKKTMMKKKTMLAIIMKKLRAANVMHSITLIEILVKAIMVEAFKK